MKEKIGNFFEEHIEKMVLVVVVLVCMWLLIVRVLFSPNLVEYDGQEFSTGQIDVYISKQAESLEDRLNRKPEPKQAYELQFDDFVAKVNSAIANIDTSVYLLQPILSAKDVAAEGIYNVPLVGGVDDAELEHIRAVAYVPIGVVDEENPYNEDSSEPNDLDFVTVEAKFDVARLYESFHESFGGEDVKEEWRDPCLAVPIFAAVHVQRQELLGDGGWSEWDDVPRTRIDPRKKMFEIIEDISELPAGGMKVRLLQFDDSEVRMDLLQPEAYMIASAKEEWFPPLLHKKYSKQQKEQAAQERREARETEKEERQQERERIREERISKRAARTTPSPSSAGGGMGEMMMEMMMGGGGPPSGTTRTQPKRTRTDGRSRLERARTRGDRRGGRESDRERSLETRDSKKDEKDVYDEFNEILISKMGSFARLREPFVFWAHDDTVEPDKSYRYRVRLGVFNPIAGTDQFSEQDKSLKNNVILWSEFSDVTETVAVPARLYFFPLGVQEALKTMNTVKVAISKYESGYWYSKDFTVKRGEVIGKVIENEIEAEEEEKTSGDAIMIPETVDYSTGAVLVDVGGPVNDWLGGKNLRPREYFDMLYSFDGANIEHMPIESRYWAKDLLVKFNEIKRAEKEPKEALRPWGSRTGRRRQRFLGPAGPAGPGGPDDYMRMMEEMMMQGMY